MLPSDRVKQLGYPRDEVVVIGSGLLGELRLRKPNDLDLVVSGRVFDELIADPKLSHTEKLGDEVLLGADLEIWRGWPPYDYAQLMRESQVLGGVHFVATKQLIAWKRGRGSQKDLADIEKLEEYYGRR